MKLVRIDCRSLPLLDAEPVQAVPPAEVLALDLQTFPAWGSQLTNAQYLLRERVLRATAFSRRGLWTWILQKDGEAVASCETYETPLGRRGQAAAGIAHGIASVYVPPAHRGNRYAAKLLSGLHETLQHEGVLACYLISEIGPTLYQRLGYQAHPLTLRRYAAAPPSEDHGASPPWTFLSQAELSTHLARPPALPLALHTPYDLPHLLWHIRRGQFYAETLSLPASPHVGARAGDAWAVWAPDHRKGVLMILALYPGALLADPATRLSPHSPEGEHIRGVLHAARVVAGQLGLAQIELWQNPHNARYVRGGISVAADDVPMILALSSSVREKDWQDYERRIWI